MAYRDKEKGRAYYRAYQKKWLAARRNKWLKENGPCRQCCSWERLEVDHIDPATKVSSEVWSWSEARRNEELSKCQPLCYKCHMKKTIASRYRPIRHGTTGGYCRGCRCDECSRHHKQRLRDYHDAHPRSKKKRSVSIDGDAQHS